MTRHQLVNDRGQFPAVDGWHLTPEGGLISPAERVAVIADVHLGYEWARGAGGDCVPAHSLAETLKKLEVMLARSRIERLIVAGDLVESASPCARTAADLSRLVVWLAERGVRLVLIQGNHDRSLAWMIQDRSPAAAAMPSAIPSQIVIAGWTIVHGHRPVPAERLIFGHHHPVLRVSSHSAPCFLVGKRRIILPAFSSNAAGLDVARARLPVCWANSSLRCLASTGCDLLDFGPVQTLQARMS